MIISSLHLLERVPRRQEKEQSLYDKKWESRHIDFYSALILACNSPIVIDFCNMMRDRNDRYRRLSLSVEETGARDVEQEHRDSMEATINRKPKQAVDALANHYTCTAQYLDKWVFNESSAEPKSSLTPALPALRIR